MSILKLRRHVNFFVLFSNGNGNSIRRPTNGNKFIRFLKVTNSNGNCNCKIFKIMVINSLGGEKTITLTLTVSVSHR